jgi:hypothetical protein
MVRAIPDARARLRALLQGPARPTWIVAQDEPKSYGMDPDGRIRGLLAQHYRVVGRVCGRAVLLARGAVAKAPPPRVSACG